MSIPKVRRRMRQTDRFLGDVQAVRRGRVKQRIANRIIGKLLGRATRGIWR